MSGKLMRNMLVLAVAQAGLGVPGAPTAGANAMMTRTQMPSLISGQFVERNIVRGTKGAFGSILAGEHRTIEFEVELAGGGAAGTAPKYAPVLMGAGWNETLTALTDAEYNLLSAGEPYLTLYCFVDGLRFTLTDAKGKVGCELNSLGIPVLKFRYMGVYAPITDAVLPTGTFTGWQKPKTVGKTNTPVFTIHGIPVILQQFSWDDGAALAWRDRPNFAGARNTDRKITGRAVFELTTAALKEWGEAVRLGEEAPLALQHGTTAGNIVEMTAPKLQFSGEPSLSDDGGIVMLSTQFTLVPDLGNDELVITVR